AALGIDELGLIRAAKLVCICGSTRRTRCHGPLPLLRVCLPARYRARRFVAESDASGWPRAAHRLRRLLKGCGKCAELKIPGPETAESAFRLHVDRKKTTATH